MKTIIHDETGRYLCDTAEDLRTGDDVLLASLNVVGPDCDPLNIRGVVRKRFANLVRGVTIIYIDRGKA